MTKITLIAIVAVQFVMLAHAVITIESLDTKVQEYQVWFDSTEIKIEELKKTAEAMRNTCELFLQQDALLPDYGNDQSR